MPVANIPDFIRIFQERRDYCRRLLELSRQQTSFIEADDYTQLLVVLGQKQRLLTQLDELGKRHPELWSEWRSQRDGLAAECRESCDDLLAESEALLAELLETEQTSTAELTERRDATQKQLQSLSQGSEVHQAYSEPLAPATHRHLDIDQ